LFFKYFYQGGFTSLDHIKMAAQFAELDEKIMSFENDYNALIYERDFRLDEADSIKVTIKSCNTSHIFSSSIKFI
jgi:hypothetical protein